MTKIKNDLYDYKNRYIFQDSDSFKFSLDSILLSEVLRKYNIGNKVVDLCCGNMAIGLIVSTFSNSNITGFEIQKDIYELGLESIKYNNVSNLNIINDDVNNISNYYKSDYFDTMVCNPPFFKTYSINKKEHLSIARHEINLTLDNIFSIARKHLKNDGSLFMIHRAERLDDLIIIANKYNVNVKEIFFISTKHGKNPSTVIIRAIKNSKMGVKINKEICIQDLKTYQNLFKE